MNTPALNTSVDDEIRLITAKVLREKGKFKQAYTILTQLAQQHPNHAEALDELGLIAVAVGDIPAAIQYYNLAMAADPDRPGTYIHLGETLLKQKQEEAALACFEKAFACSDRSVTLLRHLWKTSRSLRKKESAEKYLELLLLVDPHPELIKLENLDLGEVIIENAEELPKIHEKFLRDLRALGVYEITDYLHDYEDYKIKAPLNMVYHGLPTLPLRREYARCFTSRLLHYFPYVPDREMKVGIFVDPPHEPLFLKIIGGILHRWKSKDIRLTVLCQAENLDHLKNWIRNPEVDFLVYSPHPARAIKTISAARFDLLYFWEVGTSNLNYMLALMRLAPVQCTSWGSMQTTGMESMDYFISSEHQETKDGQDHYTEKLIKFKHIPTYFYKPEVSSYPEMTRAGFGIPEGGHLYLCPQHAWKIHPDFDRLADEILQADKDGILCLVEARHAHRTEALKKRLQKNIKAYKRVHIVPYQETGGYYNLLRLADVMLDLPHFGGGQTSLEAFALGTPIVTLPGKSMGGRSTYAAYCAMGIDNCIAASEADYVKKAVALGKDANLRGQIRQEILAKNTVLFENEATIQEHEEFFRQAITDYRASRLPAYAAKPKVLSVGGNDIITHPLPPHYQDYVQEVLDIDADAKPDIVCDAREMTTLKPGLYDAIFCSHNLEHYYAHNVKKVLAGFKHVLKPNGFVEAWVPDMDAVMTHMKQKNLSLEDVLYESPAGPIHVRDIFWGFDQQIEASGHDFYAHKMGFSGATLRQYFLKSGFSACYLISRASRFEIGILAFVNPPGDAMLQLFGLSKSQ